MCELLGDLVNQWHRIISKAKSPTSTPRIGQLTQPDPHMTHFISAELLLLLVNKTHYDSSFLPRKPMESDRIFVLLICTIFRKVAESFCHKPQVTVTTRVVYIQLR